MKEAAIEKNYTERKTVKWTALCLALGLVKDLTDEEIEGSFEVGRKYSYSDCHRLGDVLEASFAQSPSHGSAVE